MKILDNRGLEPPQPMMRTLKNLDQMTDGEKIAIINDRRPMFLYEELDERGYKHETEAQGDGSFQITITKVGESACLASSPLQPLSCRSALSYVRWSLSSHRYSFCWSTHKNYYRGNFVSQKFGWAPIFYCSDLQ